MSYTEKQKEYYSEIFKTISSHPDFGKMNPLDLGLECGYTEEDIQSMIQMMTGSTVTSSTSSDASRNEHSAQDTYYFLLKKRQSGVKHFSDDDCFVVKLNTVTWETKVIKKLTDYRYIGGKFHISQNILVWQKCGGNGNEKILFYENLSSGEQGKLLLDERIKKFIILHSGNVLVITYNEAILWDGNKILKRKKHSSLSCQAIVEAGQNVYFVGYSDIYKMNSDLDVKKIWDGYHSDYNYTIGAIEYNNNQLYWYMYKEDIKFFGDNTWSYKKYSEKSPASFSMDSTGFYASKVGTNSEPLTGIFTQNYRLLQKEIRSKDNAHKICAFNRNTDSYGNQGQVVGIYDRDIFIGVKEKSRSEDIIIKIDLQNERAPQEIPVSYQGILEE